MNLSMFADSEKSRERIDCKQGWYGAFCAHRSISGSTCRDRGDTPRRRWFLDERAAYGQCPDDRHRPRVAVGIRGFSKDVRKAEPRHEFSPRTVEKCSHCYRQTRRTRFSSEYDAAAGA